MRGAPGLEIRPVQNPQQLLCAATQRGLKAWVKRVIFRGHLTHQTDRSAQKKERKRPGRLLRQRQTQTVSQGPCRPSQTGVPHSRSRERTNPSAFYEENKALIPESDRDRTEATGQPAFQAPVQTPLSKTVSRVHTPLVWAAQASWFQRHKPETVGGPDGHPSAGGPEPAPAVTSPGDGRHPDRTRWLA